MELVKREARKSLNEEFHNLYSSLDIIKVIKSRRREWAERIALMGEIFLFQV
jgi:hypothetical protein